MTYSEILAACPGIDPSDAEDARFVTSQVQAGGDAKSARKAWIAELHTRIKISRATTKAYRGET